jgi:thiosulfate reductase cytochrome b subunit
MIRAPGSLKPLSAGNKFGQAVSNTELYYLPVERCSVMKFVAALMVLIGVVIGTGAVLEFRYFGPDATQFWVGVFTTPASVLFIVAGILLWRRGRGARRIVLMAGLVMATATLAATALDVMGPPATLLGFAGALTAIGWAWRSRALAV